MTTFDLTVMERIVDLARIIEDLKQERERIGRAIAALEGSASKLGEKKLSGAAQGAPASGGKQRPGITPGGRRRLSLALKKRWAERRKKGA
jgi:hypothetical protein